MEQVQTYHKIMNELPDELTRIVDSYVDPEIDYYRTQIALLPLNCNGWKIGNNLSSRHDYFFTDTNLKNIVQCMHEIPLLFRISRNYKVGSYSGKHIIENYRSGIYIRNNYISNGEFIAAMILLGFKYKKPDWLNLVFNAIRIKDKKASNNFP